jgi:hypothetical protein
VRDLAPQITRQRLVIEGTCPEPITDEQIKDYLKKLSLTGPISMVGQDGSTGRPLALISMLGSSPCCSLVSTSILVRPSMKVMQSPLHSSTSRRTRCPTRVFRG